MVLDSFHGKAYAYKWGREKLSYFVVLISCFASLIVFIYLFVEREFGLFSHVIQERLLMGTPLWPVILCIVVSAVALWGSCMYFSSFQGILVIDEKKISLSSIFRSTTIALNDIRAFIFAKHLKVGAINFESTREEIAIISANKKITIYQEIDNFDWIKQHLITISAKQGIAIVEERNR